MIIKRVKDGTLIKALYESSNIVGSTYDTALDKLKIIFKNGGCYTYENVINGDYYRFELAESQGVEFNSRIKKHTTIKNEPVDISGYINEINKLQLLELEQCRNNLYDYIKNFTEHFSNDDVSLKLGLNNLVVLINEYKSKL